MVECLVPFTGHCDLDLWPSFLKNHVQSISLILLKVGIPNLMVGCNFGWRSVNGVAECKYRGWNLPPNLAVTPTVFIPLYSNFTQ